MKQINVADPQSIIHARLDVSIKIRNAAWLLYCHEMEKTPHSGEKVLVRVLIWIDEQKKREALRRLEPSAQDKYMMHLLVNEGMTFKQIALKTRRTLTNIKQHFRRMRQRQGIVTMYQLVALSVARGWVRMETDDQSGSSKVQKFIGHTSL